MSKESLTDGEKLKIATDAIQGAYDDLQVVFSQKQMMDEPIPEAVKILRKALIEIKEIRL